MGFCYYFDQLVSSLKQRSHVARKKQPIRQPAKKPKGRVVIENVSHQRGSGHVVEKVVVVETPECALYLRIPEVKGSVIDGYSASQFLSNSEMRSSPSHFLIWSDQPGRNAGNGNLPGMRRRLYV